MSWQRLGHLKLVSSLARDQRGATLEGISTAFSNLVASSRKVPREYRRQVTEYVSIHRPNRYRRGLGPDTPVELQDLYLSEPNLPSRSGAISGETTDNWKDTVYVEIPTWAVRLRLLRSGSYTVTDRGKALLAIRPHEGSYKQGVGITENPFLLTPGEQFFFLCCLLDADGDLILRLYSRLMEGVTERTIPLKEVGREIGRSLDQLRTERLRHPVSSDMTQMAIRMDEMIRLIQRQGDKVVGPRMAACRTEPLVDCNLIKRPDRSKMEYYLSGSTKAFVAEMKRADSIDQFLENGLASSTALLSSSTVNPRPECAPRYVAQSYLRLRSGLGYCSIREVAMLSVSISLDEQSCFFEVRDAERSIMDLAHAHGQAIRFAKSRQGDVALVRIEQRLAKEIAGE